MKVSYRQNTDFAYNYISGSWQKGVSQGKFCRVPEIKELAQNATELYLTISISFQVLWNELLDVVPILHVSCTDSDSYNDLFSLVCEQWLSPSCFSCLYLQIDLSYLESVCWTFYKSAQNKCPVPVFHFSKTYATYFCYLCPTLKVVPEAIEHTFQVHESLHHEIEHLSHAKWSYSFILAVSVFQNIFG